MGDQAADNSAPYTSTIVFLVRKGNPKGIKDWADLVKPDVQVITPNPKTSGGARWNYLAAWGYVLKNGGDEAEGAGFRRRTLQACARARHRRARLDHHLRAARHRRRSPGLGERGAIWPSTNWGRISWRSSCRRVSILAEPPVAIVDKVVDEHGTRAVAEAYLQYLYSPAGQEIAAKNFYRPRLAEVAQKYASQVPEAAAVHDRRAVRRLEDGAGEHFADGGVFDQIYTQPSQ